VAVPQVLAMNNEPAVMRIGARQASFVPAAMHGRPRPRPGDPVPGAADGLTLTLTPQISADGIVHLSVSPAFTGLPGDVEGDFTLRVRGGDTVVIAGPLPGGGAAATGAERKELVMLITPTVVGAGGSPVAGAQ
jgi:type II secretory pathway component GspD/PulD (secretin)